MDFLDTCQRFLDSFKFAIKELFESEEPEENSEDEDDTFYYSIVGVIVVVEIYVLYIWKPFGSTAATATSKGRELTDFENDGESNSKKPAKLSLLDQDAIQSQALDSNLDSDSIDDVEDSVLKCDSLDHGDDPNIDYTISKFHSKERRLSNLYWPN